MYNLLIFGGTTEGRLLADYCISHRIHAYISVTSGYGRELLAEHEYLRIRVGAMDEGEIVKFLEEHSIRLAVDATHPYAVQATDHIKGACARAEVPYIRCTRSESSGYGASVMTVESEEEAVKLLEKTKGNIFLTTGSKRLLVFSGLSDYRERIYARVLPSADIIAQCERAGFPDSRLICMQGPFSRELNVAMLRQTGAAFLVTKEAGKAGGFEEKLAAARDCGCQVIVIKRRAEETGGLSFEAVCAKLLVWRDETETLAEAQPLCVTLAGVGPGAAGQITEAVREAIKSSDTVLGAPRILEAVRLLPECAGKDLLPVYLPEQAKQWLARREVSASRAVFLFSGDTGFYSGAGQIKELLEQRGISYRILPGISSVSYFAARLGTVWEDACFFTAHGREFDAAAALRSGVQKMFLLLGGVNSAGRLCETLCTHGFGQVRISVGERLSYPDERILTGRAETLKGESFGPLCLVLIEIEGEAS